MAAPSRFRSSTAGPTSRDASGTCRAACASTWGTASRAPSSGAGAADAGRTPGPAVRADRLARSPADVLGSPVDVLSGSRGSRRGSAEVADEDVDRLGIARRALADDAGDRDVVEEVDGAERLACRGIGQVYLDEWPRDREQGVAQRHARVRQAAGVDDRAVEVPVVEPVAQPALVVRLVRVDVDPELRRPRADAVVDVGEGLRAIDLRLARADEVQVR